MLLQQFQSPIGRVRHAEVGFTYIGLLILIAILGMVSAVSVQVGSIFQRRIAEEALLDIGAEYQRALKSYASATAVGQQPLPPALEDLLKDSRHPKVVRHLRRIYDDPLTGKNTWGLIYAKGNRGIVGIHSLSDQKSIKVGDFSPHFAQFKNKTFYREWIFVNPALSHN